MESGSSPDSVYDGGDSSNPSPETTNPSSPSKETTMPSTDGSESVGKAPETPVDFTVSVDASPNGMMQTVLDLREKLKDLYPDMNQAPEGVQEFMKESENLRQYSIDKGLLVPGEANESAVTMKGGQMGVDEKGQIVYSDSRTGTDILSGEGKFDGEYFDSNPVDTSPVSVEAESASTTASTSAPSENIVNTENIPTESPKPTIGTIPMEYTVETKPDGTKYLQFNKSTLEGMNVFQKSYLSPDVSLQSYALRIAESPDFQKLNSTNISTEKIFEDMKKTLNGFILRDQMIRTGGLDPMSEQYAILESERKIFLNELKKFERFGKNPILVSGWDTMSHSPEGDYMEKSSRISVPIEINTEPTYVTETKPTVISGTDSLSSRGLSFEVERNADGVITNMKTLDGSIRTSVISLERELGFNPNWRIDSGLPLTYEDSVDGQKIQNTLEMIRKNIAFRDAFQPETDEYKFWDKQIKSLVQNVEKKNPLIFKK